MTEIRPMGAPSASTSARAAAPSRGSGDSALPWLGTSIAFTAISLATTARVMPNWRAAIVPGLISMGIGAASGVGRSMLRNAVPDDAPMPAVVGSGAVRGASLGALAAIGAHYTRLAGQSAALARVGVIGIGIGAAIGAALGVGEAMFDRQVI